MFIDKDSLKIDGVNMGQYLTSVKYGFNKLWGEDSGRNLKGDMVASLIGVFPKFELQFRRLSSNEIKTLAPIFDKATQTVSYYDPLKKTTISIKTYTGDWGIDYFEIDKSRPFSISFIARSKR